MVGFTEVYKGSISLIQNGESINANGNPDLISKLDNFITPDCYYKTPDDISGWLTRHDPITICFQNKPTQTQTDNLNGIRSSEDVLPGIKILS